MGVWLVLSDGDTAFPVAPVPSGLRQGLGMELLGACPYLPVTGLPGPASLSPK